MLATLGFTVTGILFMLFALKVKPLADQKSKQIFNRYALAYMLLAVAFVLWGLASVNGTREVLALSVVIGDILLLAATILMIDILFANNPRKNLWLYGAAVTGAGLLIVRTVFFYPEPFMVDEILYFNSQRLVSFTIASVFLLIWLPVNLQIAHLLTRKAQSLASTYTLLYTAASLSAVIFLLSKAPLTLALSFTAISVSVVGLIISNEYLKALRVANHGK